MNEKLSKKIAVWITPVIVGLGFFGLRKGLWRDEAFNPLRMLGASTSIERELEKAAEDINRDAPKRLDDITVLTHAEAGPGKKITYFYELAIPAADQPITPEDKTNLTESIRNGFCAEEDMRKMQQEGVEFAYSYVGPSQKPFVTISSQTFECVQ